MKGWGLVSWSISVGVFMAAGCGGRTGTVGDEYTDPDGPGSAGSGAGSGKAGGKSTAGRSGSSTGGAFGTGGARPIPVGGSPYTYGGAYVGGGFSVGGAIAGVGGFSFGGVGGFSFGGVGGFSFGGVSGIGGAIPVGGYGGQPMDCETCIWSRCNAELAQCFQDFGCISIFACMQATGCETFACYSPDTCRGTIDQWGGPGGPSMSMLLKAVTCSVQSGCPCN